MIHVHRVELRQGAVGHLTSVDSQRLGDHLALSLVADAEGAGELWAVSAEVTEASRSEWRFETDVRWPEDTDGTMTEGFGSAGLPRRVWLWRVLVPLHEAGLIRGLLDVVDHHGAGLGKVRAAIPERARDGLLPTIEA